jgi:hypothetical protein
MVSLSPMLCKPSQSVAPEHGRPILCEPWQSVAPEHGPAMADRHVTALSSLWCAATPIGGLCCRTLYAMAATILILRLLHGDASVVT